MHNFTKSQVKVWPVVHDTRHFMLEASRMEGEGGGRYEVEWCGKVEIPGRRRSMQDYILTFSKPHNGNH